MKHLKHYEEENINDEPQIGDFVICDANTGSYRLNNFIKNKIGVCIGPHYSGNKPELKEKLANRYKIKYDNVPDDIEKDYFPFPDKTRSFHKKDILFFSQNIEDLKTILSANKYNL